MTEETRFKKKLITYLNSQNIYNIPYPSSSRYGKSGIPDRLACVNGIFFAIETKSETGEASELQKHNVKLINKSNGIAIILYPSGFERFKKLVEEVLKCNSHIAGLNALRNVHTSSNYIILMN